MRAVQEKEVVFLSGHMEKEQKGRIPDRGRTGYERRLAGSFQKAPVLSFTRESRIVLFSDCHRGCGSQGDNFLKNRHLYLAALAYYYDREYCYIELGDGDELWENRNMKCIYEIHSDVFALLSRFAEKGRLYMLYGNHDYQNRKDTRFPHYGGLILREEESGAEFYLTHGNQVDLLNSVFWRLSRFLVRYLWKPLEQFGVSDPTSAARNYRVKGKNETRLSRFAESRQINLIAGHTHRPVLGDRETRYFNTGSCVHPSGVTCLEIASGQIYLVKWSMETREDQSLYVARSVLAGPREVEELK